jgi:hypothetical protein
MLFTAVKQIANIAYLTPWSLNCSWFEIFQNMDLDYMNELQRGSSSCVHVTDVLAKRAELKSPVWWPRLKNSPIVIHSCRKRRLKWVPSAWGYSWATRLLGSQIRRPGPPGWGWGAGLTIQPRKKVIVTKLQRGGHDPIWAAEPYDDDIT